MGLAQKTRRLLLTIFLFAAAMAGYHHSGWITALAWAMSGVALYALGLVGLVLLVGGLQYYLDRARVSRFSIEELREIVAMRPKRDLYFAFWELARRGIDTNGIVQPLLVMLDSDDPQVRSVGLRKLKSIHRRLDHILLDERPEGLRARVEAIIAESGRRI